jgi:hypothetical protein
MTAKLDKDFVHSEIEKEGWKIHNEYVNSGEFLILNKPDFYGGVKTRLSWASWGQGRRPHWRSIIDKTKYIKSVLELEGWALHNTYTGQLDYLVISKPDYFGGSKFNFMWKQWVKGHRPDFRALADKTEFVTNHLRRLGYEIIEPFEYSHSHDQFSVLKNGIVYTTNWGAVRSGQLPGSFKLRVCNQIRDFFRRGRIKPEKDFSISRLFSDNYYARLAKKFDCDIPENHHVDHIIPLSYFGESLKQIRLAFHPKNLRIIKNTENVSRNNKLKKEELDYYDLWWLFNVAENPKNYQPK